LRGVVSVSGHVVFIGGVIAVIVAAYCYYLTQLSTMHDEAKHPYFGPQVLPTVFVSWYIFNREELVKKKSISMEFQNFHFKFGVQ
jgi:hypothetical protein